MPTQLICIIVAISSWTFGKQPSPAIQPTYRQIVDENVALRAEVLKLRSEIDSMRGRPTTQPAAGDKVAIALRRHQPEIGMTLEQWRALDGAEFPHFYAEKSGSNGDVDYYLLSVEGVYGTDLFEVDVVDGKITRWGYKRAKGRPQSSQFNPR